VAQRLLPALSSLLVDLQQPLALESGEGRVVAVVAAAVRLVAGLVAGLAELLLPRRLRLGWHLARAAAAPQSEDVPALEQLLQLSQVVSEEHYSAARRLGVLLQLVPRLASLPLPDQVVREVGLFVFLR
jgi:hypothetical protein